MQYLEVKGLSRISAVGRRESLQAQAKTGCLNHLSKEQKENEERMAKAHRSYG